MLDRVIVTAGLVALAPVIAGLVAIGLLSAMGREVRRQWEGTGRNEQ